MARIPLIESVPTKEPILELAPGETVLVLPEYLIKDKKDVFTLMVIDDSMAGRVENGDLVLFQKGLKPESKDMAVVYLEDQYILREIEFINDIIPFPS